MSKASALAVADSEPSSPARAELAAAITRLALAKQRALVAKSAAEVFWLRKIDARDAVAAAETAFEAAQAAMVDARPDGDQAPSLRAARGALDDARDVLDALNGGEARLEADASAAECALMIADMNLKHVISAAVKSDERVQKLIADFMVAQRQYVSLQWIMSFLDGKNALPDGTKGWDCNQREWPELASIPVAWKAAFVALDRDANAMLPE